MNDYKEISFKVFLIFIPLFLIFGIWDEYRKSHCPSLQAEVDKKLEFLKNPDAIEEMKLKKIENQYANNLVSHEVVFTDPIILEQVSRMISNRTKGEWNRPTRGWEAIMSLKLYSGDTLDIEVTSIQYGKPGETHLYFLFDECTDEYPNFSLTLGNFLEELTR
jgi:hypothetical protein